MKITLAGVVIVDTLNEVSGLWANLDQTMQLTAPFRAEWQKGFARGGRLYTLPLTVWDPPHHNAGESMVEMFRRLEQVPVEGELVLEEQGELAIFPWAGVRNGHVVRRIELSDGYAFELLVTGPASFATTAATLATLDGEELVTLAGEQLLILES